MDTKLIDMAITARDTAYAPYSGYRVGAALLAEDGTVYTGCNIENASFGATVCAERVALFKAVSEGQKRFTAIAVAGGKDGVEEVSPCGICRQTLSEFCDGALLVILSDGKGGCIKTTLSALLPMGFDKHNL